MLEGLRDEQIFPAAAYERVEQSLAHFVDTNLDHWMQFAGGWNAVAYRYNECREHSDAFTRSIVARPSPPDPERYVQERELFGFFVSGLSALEAAGYSMYFIAVLADRSALGDVLPARAVTIDAVVKAFRDAGSMFEPMTSALSVLNKTDHTYSAWKDFRNILCHRAHPGRSYFVGGDKDGKTLSAEIEIASSTTTARLEWLRPKVIELVDAADRFCRERL